MIRTARFAGSWYTNDPTKLKAVIDSSIAEIGSIMPSRFAVLPHAGLSYSKRGIAPFFGGDFSAVERIVIIAPSHYAHIAPDRLASAPFSAAQTPLGNLKVIALSEARTDYREAIEAEHALEMVLPYIANLPSPPAISMALLSHFSTAEAISKLADALIEELGEKNIREGKTLLIASSDFTHYGPRFSYTPFGRDGQAGTKESDLAFANLLIEGNTEEAYRLATSQRLTICGHAASVLVAEIATRFEAEGRIHSYYTSSDVQPSFDPNFVAYATLLWS